MKSYSRLLLVRHAPTAATRRHAFPIDEPLDEAGEAAAGALRGRFGDAAAVSAPAARCRRTAVLAGCEQVASDPRWSELHFGDWAGSTLDEIGERDPERLRTWLADPRSAPPGGESLPSLRERVRAALDGLAETAEDTAVFTSAGPVKAAIAAVLDAPDGAFWRLDVAPCSITVLHCRSGVWTVRSVNTAPGRETR
ncbi:histidine phosphatase family protein [Glycomyces tarimensis]